MSGPSGAQLPLPLPEAGASYDPSELIADASNAEALAWLDRPADWPFGRLALWGGPKVGKTHLLRLAAAQRGFAVLPGGGPALRGLPEVPPGVAGLALDDADQVAEEAALFHLINLCAERGAALLLAGREPPARWPVALPDLRSRLRGTTAVQVRPAGEALLDALLVKHFADRQLRVDAAFRAWLLARLPRDAASVADAAARLDQAALAAGGRITRALARTTLAELPGMAAHASPGEAAAADPIDDESMAVDRGSSPGGAGRL